MKKPPGNKYDLGALFLTAALIRVWYYWHLHVSVTSDTKTYIQARVNILDGDVDPLRTPIYPWFLKLVQWIGPTRNFLHDVFIIQALLSFASIWLFYKIALSLLKMHPLVLAATWLYALSPAIANYDMCVLSESISIDAMLVFLFLMTNYLEKPTRSKAFFYTLFVLVLVMLRPAFIYMYGVMILFCIGIARWGLLAMALNMLLLIVYIHRNSTLNGVNSISRVSAENQLELIGKYDIYPLGGDSTLTRIIRTNLRDTTRFFLGLLQDSLREEQIPPARVDRYVRTAISAAPGAYIQKTLARGWSMQSEPATGIFAQRGEHNSRFTNFILQFNPVNFFFVSLLLIVSLIPLIRTRKVCWFPLLLWAIITAHYLVTFLGARTDHPRLFVIAIPLLILLFFHMIAITISRKSHPAQTASLS
jgi:hypothetical protein